MDCYITETDDTYEYKVEDVPPEYRDTLSHFFFSEVENGYQKIYQKSTLMFPHSDPQLPRRAAKNDPSVSRCGIHEMGNRLGGNHPDFGSV